MGDACRDGNHASIGALQAAAECGDGLAAQQLFSELYRELRRMARQQLSRCAPGVTPGASTLLHETDLSICSRGSDFPDRARFFGCAAKLMRGLIIDHLRERRALKRGGEYHLSALDTQIADAATPDGDLAPLDAALEELAGADAPLSELVDLEFFCGLSFAEIAAMRGVSERTVQRDWHKARLYLHAELRSDG
jgi:RNA polymerase sigma factor (TIGR02999 family)